MPDVAELLRRVFSLLVDIGFIFDAMLTVIAVTASHYILAPRSWERQKRVELTLAPRIKRSWTAPTKETRKKRILPANIIGFVGTFLLLLAPLLIFLGPIGLFFALLLGLFVAIKLGRTATGKKRKGIDSQLVNFLYTLNGYLSSGQNLYQALIETNKSNEQPLKGQIQLLIGNIQKSGITPALERTRLASPSDNFRRILSDLIAANQQNLSPEGIADRVEHRADTLSESKVYEDKLANELATARASQMTVMAMLPAMFILNVLLRGSSMSLFWTTTIGRIALLFLLGIELFVYWFSGRAGDIKI